jgi:hypothetical protein
MTQDPSTAIVSGFSIDEFLQLSDGFHARFPDVPVELVPVTPELLGTNVTEVKSKLWKLEDLEGVLLYIQESN